MEKIKGSAKVISEEVLERIEENSVFYSLYSLIELMNMFFSSFFTPSFLSQE